MPGTLEGSAILEGAFAADRLYNFSLWDKLYSAELCKKSFACVKDGEFPKANDKYAYFILSYFARTYRGLPSERLYEYHFGRGATGRNLLSPSEFEIYCSMALVADAIRDFLETQGDLAALRRGVRERQERAAARLRRSLDAPLGREGQGDGVRHDARVLGSRRGGCQDRAVELGRPGPRRAAPQGLSRFLSQPVGEVRVVGTYYHRYANGGVQRVISMLIQLWLDLGYEVVLFTDLPPSEHDYHLPEGVQRVVLPSSFDVKKKTYIHRARAIATAMAEYGIDVMVYHAWVSTMLLWDLLVYKALGVGLVVHCHSVFSQPARSARAYFADMPPIYALCDAVIALSEADQAYWANFNGNVTRVVNPLGIDPASVEPSDLSDKTVLWLGRMSDEKRPHEALRIFAMVREEEPDARLLMVGQAPDPEYMDGLNALIAELGIRDSVEMCGFHKDVAPFYKRASVFLMTSEYEGFPQVLSECQASGVPCVMYELPYLTLTRSQRGVVSVEMGDMSAAADAVTRLLREPGVQAASGRGSAGEHRRAGRLRPVRYLERRVRRRVTRRHGSLPLPDETTRIMWETLFTHYRTGVATQSGDMRQLRKELAAAKRREMSLANVRRLAGQGSATRPRRDSAPVVPPDETAAAHSRRSRLGCVLRGVLGACRGLRVLAGGHRIRPDRERGDPVASLSGDDRADEVSDAAGGNGGRLGRDARACSGALDASPSRGRGLRRTRGGRRHAAFHDREGPLRARAPAGRQRADSAAGRRKLPLRAHDGKPVFGFRDQATWRCARRSGPQRSTRWSPAACSTRCWWAYRACTWACTGRATSSPRGFWAARGSRC